MAEDSSFMKHLQFVDFPQRAARLGIQDHRHRHLKKVETTNSKHEKKLSAVAADIEDSINIYLVSDLKIEMN